MCPVHVVPVVVYVTVIVQVHVPVIVRYNGQNPIGFPIVRDFMRNEWPHSFGYLYSHVFELINQTLSNPDKRLKNGQVKGNIGVTRFRRKYYFWFFIHSKLDVSIKSAQKLSKLELIFNFQFSIFFIHSIQFASTNYKLLMVSIK